jgi:hypothetical protein
MAGQSLIQVGVTLTMTVRRALILMSGTILQIVGASHTLGSGRDGDKRLKR